MFLRLDFISHFAEACVSQAQFPHCHLLKQGGNKMSVRCSLLTLSLPPEEEKKEEKGESVYKNF